MPTTTSGLRYPASSAAPNIPQDIQNLASDIESRVMAPVTLRKAERLSNNVLAGNSQAYGTSTAGYIVVPADTITRMVRIDADFDIYCGSSAATAGSLRLYANATELVPSSAQWGTFQNNGAGSTVARPVTAHIRWEGTLPAAAQNIWINVVGDAASQAFWVTGSDVTAVYR